MNNATIINTFNNDQCYIANIKTQNRQITTSITNGVLKFESMIKLPVVFPVVITFININLSS